MINDYNTPNSLAQIKQLLLLTEYYITKNQTVSVNKYLLENIKNYVDDYFRNLGFKLDESSNNNKLQNEVNKLIIEKFISLRNDIKTYAKSSSDKSYLFKVSDRIRNIVYLLYMYIYILSIVKWRI